MFLIHLLSLIKNSLKEEILPTDYIIKTQRPDLSSWQFNIPLVGDRA